MDEQNLAIDIQLKKLLDWLISRRICNRDWHEHVVQVSSNFNSVTCANCSSSLDATGL
jgi:hypothetical protein